MTVAQHFVGFHGFLSAATKRISQRCKNTLIFIGFSFYQNFGTQESLYFYNHNVTQHVFSRYSYHTVSLYIIQILYIGLENYVGLFYVLDKQN